MSIEIICGDAREVMAGMPAALAQTCICSPPYFGLRSYGGGEQEIGTEQTPQEYVAALVEVFGAVRRVLRDDGTLWVVLGDSYAQGEIRHRNGQSGSTARCQATDAWARGTAQTGRRLEHGVPLKSLLGMPWRVAFALQEDGWVLRSEIVWHKLAAMPESVRDRVTRAHETVFMLAKQDAYYYDAAAIAEPAETIHHYRRYHTRAGAPLYADKNGQHGFFGPQRGHGGLHQGSPDRAARRNKRSVWMLGPQPLAQEHYAAFPEKLVEPMILAGCPEGGTVLDPFCGSGTTLLVAKRLGRTGVGIDLNPAYCRLAEKRCASIPYPLFSAAGSGADYGAAR